MPEGPYTLGVDFGTSNSAAGYMADGQPRLVTWEDGRDTIPTTFFFDAETRQTLVGEPANQALLDGDDGRFMRALKRVLGTPLMHEVRQVLNKRVTFVQIIGRFLQTIKERAEAESGREFTRVLSGRPVVFHGADDPREAQAEADLRACYLAAGFDEVAFMAEPEAAAIASGALEQSDTAGLIVDIGGGTSDFSLFQSTGGAMEILANHGVRIGGTDFDRAISIDRVMPLLGKGTLLRNVFGDGKTPTPVAIYNDLATWEMIPFLYTQQNRRMAKEMAQMAEEPAKLNRLLAVLTDILGHDLAFAVERGKIAANGGGNTSDISLEVVEPGLSASLSGGALATILAPFADQLRAGALETLAMASMTPSQVDRVIYVGGTSLMEVVPETMRAVFPGAEHSFSEVFSAVTYGLARASARP